MHDLFWALVGALMEAVDVTDLTAEVPPFSEGPEAHRCNQMSQEAPHGPNMWKGGD
jgi:hypothetical protein